MKTWIEEKNQYKIEHGSELKWIELHDIYHSIGLGHILSDVDVIIELEKEVIYGV